MQQQCDVGMLWSHGAETKTTSCFLRNSIPSSSRCLCVNITRSSRSLRHVFGLAPYLLSWSRSSSAFPFPFPHIHIKMQYSVRHVVVHRAFSSLLSEAKKKFMLVHDACETFIRLWHTCQLQCHSQTTFVSQFRVPSDKDKVNQMVDPWINYPV